MAHKFRLISDIAFRGCSLVSSSVPSGGVACFVTQDNSLTTFQS